MTPEIFVPGLISTEEAYELNALFSQDGREFYCEIVISDCGAGHLYTAMVSCLEQGVWTRPRPDALAGCHSTMDLCFSPDGDRLYFTMNRSVPPDSGRINHIWYAERTKKGWSKARILGPPIFSMGGDSQPSLSRNGTMYFRIGDDLYISRTDNGHFATPEKLGPEINSPWAESKPCVARDERFLLFVRYAMPDSVDGGKGMYISFRKEDGS
jgi:hypothetical protein